MRNRPAGVGVGLRLTDSKLLLCLGQLRQRSQ